MLGIFYTLALLLEIVFFEWLSILLSPRPFMNTPKFYLGEVVEVAVTFSTLRGRVAPPTPPPCKGEYMTPPTTPPCIQGPSGTHIPHGFPYKPPPVSCLLSLSCLLPPGFLSAWRPHILYKAKNGSTKKQNKNLANNKFTSAKLKIQGKGGDIGSGRSRVRVNARG